MTDQTIRQIIKSYIFGANIEELSNIYRFSQTTIQQIIDTHQDMIKAASNHYKKMEGKK